MALQQLPAPVNVSTIQPVVVHLRCMTPGSESQSVSAREQILLRDRVRVQERDGESLDGERDKIHARIHW